MSRIPTKKRDLPKLTENQTLIICAIIALFGSIIPAIITSVVTVDSRLGNLKMIDIQSGVGENIAADNCTGTSLSSGAVGSRKYEQKIGFQRPFTGLPAIFLSPVLIDASKDQNLRLSTYATGISAEGFTLVVQTWYDSKICGVQVQWIAYQNQ